MNNLYSIGETARLNNISIQTLRYYDKFGLFTPEHINQENGYRFYHSRQFFYLDIIKSLKYIQTPLEDIKEIISDTPENMLQHLHHQEVEIQKEKEKIIQAEQLLKRRKNQLMEQLKLAKRIENEDIYTRHVEEQALLRIPTTNANPITEPYAQARILAEVLEDQCSLIDNQCSYTYSLANYQKTNDTRYEYVYTTAPDLPIELSSDKENIERVTFAAGEYICIAFEWSPEAYIEHYQKLFDHIRKNQLKTEGNVYEVSVPMNFSPLHEDRFISELRVKKN